MTHPVLKLSIAFSLSVEEQFPDTFFTSTAQQSLPPRASLWAIGLVEIKTNFGQSDQNLQDLSISSMVSTNTWNEKIIAA